MSCRMQTTSNTQTTGDYELLKMDVDWNMDNHVHPKQVSQPVLGIIMNLKN